MIVVLGALAVWALTSVVMGLLLGRVMAARDRQIPH